MKIIPITKQDSNQIADLYEQYLNSGAYARSCITNSITQNGFAGYKAVENNQIAGYISGTPEIQFTYPHPKLENSLKTVFPNARIFSFDALLVIPKYRHQGLAGRLGRRLLADVKQKDYHFILTELWVHPNGTIPANVIAAEWGELAYEKYCQRFYEKLSDYNMYCPLCGTDCICGAIVRLYRVGNKEE